MRFSMKPNGLPLAALAALLIAAPGAGIAQSTVAKAGAGLIRINTGRGQLVTLAHPMTDLFVADPNVADVQVRSPTQLYVFGKKPGETTISATSRSGAVIYASTVQIGNNLDSIGQMLGLAMPEARIVATPMNGMVLLTGTVAAPEDAAEAERLVQGFVGDTTKVLSRLRTATPLQVNLQVRFAEVNRSFLKQVGVNVASFDGTGGFKFGIGQGRNFYPNYAPNGGLFTGGGGGASSLGTTSITNGATGSTLGLAGRVLGLNLLGAIDLGETIGQVTTLANPNLTALSGETGTFLAGGEIPIPLAQALGTISVEYKQYGVSLAYTPTVLSDGRISLRVRPEVSQLDYSNAISLSGTRVPGLTTRRAETTIELGSGQSMMIGGLLQNSQNNSVNKTPFLGDIPILGALFRSNSFQRNETELVIIITPYLVKPVNDTRDVALPTDGYRTPGDAERILLGNVSNGVSGAQRPVPSAGVAPSSSETPSNAPQIGSRSGPVTLSHDKGVPAPGFSQ